MDPAPGGLGSVASLVLAAVMPSHNPWDQAARLKPKLRIHTRIYTHAYRGSTWHVLQDRANTRYYRFTPGVMSFVERLDGNSTVGQILDELKEERGKGAPSEQEILGLLSRLHNADLLQGDMPSDGTELARRDRKQRRMKRRQRLMRPLSIRIPLADPDRLLKRITPWFRPVFGKTGLVIWTILVCAGLVSAAAHWQGLSTHAVSRALDPGNVLLMLLIYPFVKALHELGHALSAKHWGGEVHEMGIMLLVLMPIPYVDATSANAFPGKWQRILTGASGIMVEVLLAAVAAILWINIQPGIVRDIAFDVMVIGGISTLLFNGNPLLRFDGYYVLADWLEIPNLGPRSTRYLGYLVKRHLFGMQELLSPVTAPGERGWFLFYGLASFLYRLFISFSIALFIAGKFFILGVILAIWALGAQLLLPLFRNLKFLFFDPSLGSQRKRGRALLTAGGLLTAVIITLLTVPVPNWTRAEGVLTLPERSKVRAQEDGFVIRSLKGNGEPVNQGEPLFETEDPLLPPRIEVLKSRIDELKARQTVEFMTDRVQVGILEEKITRLVKELREQQDRLDQLTLRSPLNGEFRVSRAQDLPGRFVKRGDLLGHVVDFSGMTARVVVPQTALDQVRHDTTGVEVRLPGEPALTITASIRNEVPSVSNRLPSRALGTQGGGTIAVDARDEAGLKSIEPVYQLEISLPSHDQHRFIGSRVHIRFNHSAEPLAHQWLRSLRQLFLARLEV